jgi:Zn finger protein HypA/HybF involved in hydrogenase expression
MERLIKLMAWCWNCEDTTLQEELFPKEEHADIKVTLVRSKCLECHMHNTQVFSPTNYARAEKKFENAYAAEPIH